MVRCTASAGSVIVALCSAKANGPPREEAGKQELSARVVATRRLRRHRRGERVRPTLVPRNPGLSRFVPVYPALSRGIPLYPAVSHSIPRDARA